MKYSLITDVASEPITLAEIKYDRGITDSTHDDYLTSLITAARQYAEHKVQRVIGEQTWQYTGDIFPDHLLKPPLVSVDWVKTYIDDSLTTWDASNYRVNTSVPGSIEPVNGLPSYDSRWDAVQIQFVCGVAPSEKVTDAIRKLAAHLFEVREPVVVGMTVNKVPYSVDALLSSELWGDYS